MAILSRKKNVEDLVIQYGNILLTRVWLGDIAGARDAGRAGLRLARETGDERHVAELLLDLGSVAASSGQTEKAVRLLAYATSQLKSLGLGRIVEHRESGGVIREKLEALLETAEIDRITSEGAAWSEDQAVEEAMKA